MVSLGEAEQMEEGGGCTEGETPHTCNPMIWINISQYVTTTEIAMSSYETLATIMQ